MALLPLVTLPDTVLKKVAKPVAVVDDRIRKLIDDMFETMYAAPGIGLAAPQVGVSERVAVIDIMDPETEKPNPIAMVNPELTWLSDEKSPYHEGCLSIPGQFADVIRPSRLKVTWLDRMGKRQEMEADGLLAKCVQHEIDHLNGILFVNHLSNLKRNMLLRRFEKNRS